MGEAVISIGQKINRGGGALISTLSTRLSLQGKFSIHRNVESKCFMKFRLFPMCTMIRNMTSMKRIIKFNDNSYNVEFP